MHTLSNLRVREITRMTMIASGSQPQLQQTTPSDHLFRGISSISSSLTSRLGNLKENSLIGDSFGNLLSQVKNLIPSQKTTVITNIVQALMNNTPHSPVVQDYLYFDRRFLRQSPLSSQESNPIAKNDCYYKHRASFDE